MSHPSTGREDVYPEDKVTHYPHKKTGQKSGMSHNKGTAKSRALTKAMKGTSEEAHLTIVKAAKHASKYHDKAGCSVCSKFK